MSVRRNPSNSGQNDVETDLDSVPSGGMIPHVEPPGSNFLLSPTSKRPLNSANMNEPCLGGISQFQQLIERNLPKDR